MPAKLLSFIVANTNLWLPAYSVIVQSKRGRRVIGEGVILGNYFSINYGMLHGCVVVLGVSIQTGLYSIYMKGSNRSGLIYQTLHGFTAWVYCMVLEAIKNVCYMRYVQAKGPLNFSVIPAIPATDHDQESRHIFLLVQLLATIKNS